uniref:Secreted protein n=1 Tax=Glossina morsitans morsitans TaxID=37546 RepID=A0A1B0G4E6_GLOMM
MDFKYIPLLIIVSMTTLALCRPQKDLNFEIAAPAVLSYNSPLRQPDSLKSRPYYDFISVLYAHDSTKKDLLLYGRNRRDTSTEQKSSTVSRRRRAIVFRPLFVYRQQEIKKQQLREQRKHCI